MAEIGISRTVVDDTELAESVIGRLDCFHSGGGSSSNGDDYSQTVDEGLLGGMEKFGYTKDNCVSAKTELIARETLGCTFKPDGE